MENSQREYFLKSEGDSWFSRTAENERGNFFHPLILDFLKSSIQVQHSLERVLEVGCSDGNLLERIVNSFECKYGLGLDPSQKAIEAANNRSIANLEFLRGTADAIPCADSEFDLAVAGFFFYVVDRSLYFKVVSELDRVVKPGGFVVIVDFDSNTPKKTPYRSESAVYSFRNRNAEMFLSSGHYSLVSKLTLSHDHKGFPVDPLERVSVQLLFKELDAYVSTI
jgi:ubiquinone/menaquinone biosynthesis C-methylase UbiE